MKSEHRHELKTNELAEFIEHFPQWAKSNMWRIIYVAVLLVVVIGIYFAKWYFSNVYTVKEREALTALATQVSRSKPNIVRNQSQGFDNSYMLIDLARNLQTTSNQLSNETMSAVALIKSAEAIRMEVHYRLDFVTSEQIQTKMAEAQQLYEEAIAKSPTNTSLVGMAKLGVGLCREDSGDFESARSIYQTIIDDDRFAGTAAAAQAAIRLKIMDDFKEEITFLPAPQAPTPASEELIPIVPEDVNAEDIFVPGANFITPQP